ncbi:MAG TPA: MFS transporter, partial [Gemmatimonadales bacterium]|nr:MFS transporter [Gemmatimonadales bacterium]
LGGLRRHALAPHLGAAEARRLSEPPAAPPPVPPAGGAPQHEDRFPAFLLLWASQTLSLFGTMVSQFAVNVWLARDLYPHAHQKPQLAVALTVTGVAFTAPLIFGMPLAGAYADRHDKQRVMVACDLMLALLSGVFVVLTLGGALTLPVAALLLVLYSLTSAFHAAAFDSSYGRFVKPADLPRASGMMMTSYGLSQLLAPALAATLVALPTLLGGPAALPAWLGNGVPFAFAADGLSFVVAAIVAASMRFPVMPLAAATGASLVADVRAGFRWVLTRRPFLWLLSMGALANFTFAPLMVLLPMLARDRVVADAAARGMPFEAVLALANTAGGLGGVLGGVLVSVFGLRGWSRTRVMLVCLIVLGVGEVVTGLSTTVWGLAIGMFVGESLVAPLNTASFTLWQDLTPPQMLARALATRRFIAQSAFPIGTVVAGWAAAVAEPWAVVTVAGALLVAGMLAVLAQPGFATLESRMREAAARPD